MIVAMCSGEGRTFEAVTRVIGAQMNFMICDRPEAAVLRRAEALAVPSRCIARGVFATRKEHETAILKALEEAKPFSVLALLGYMRVLSAEFLAAVRTMSPQAEIINLHPAPLSLYKGAHGLQHALASRAPYWGLSVHTVTAALDSGPVIAFRTLPVLPTDDFTTLRERAHPLEVSAVLETLDILTLRSSR